MNLPDHTPVSGHRGRPRARSGDVQHIEIRSGVNQHGEPFCTVVINHGDMLAQLTPNEVRQMALGWLESAEAAESDAAVYAALRTADMDPRAIGQFIADLRNLRNTP